ncbi:MAG: alanine--tRNA ligase [Candidatus Omnitrophica bacterium]|nr:alanine--tRNA ligase [Candidatus Omnitrophota bacterium]MDD5771199.1 alanine--tRNA ligase [Candidatus Omnitrophota bacterium]
MENVLIKADELRDKFLSFFQARGHKLAESDSLVPKDDLTVLFTPAGMNQFKKEFMGFDSGFKRAATCQRCLRTDDLEKVGKTSSHLTFFEMLGNFSFGDYFKQEAISWAWEFLTRELKIDEGRLWISVYRDDDEAYKIWKDKVGIPEGKIVRLGDKDNFWPAEAKEKGPNGPCGPCSEIFYDFGPATGCGRSECDPSCSCGRFVEIWNLVFTQFNRKEGGLLEPLPNKNIDTGMGLERLTAVMQGKQNNFETELFQPVIKEIIRSLPAQRAALENNLFYAVADHLRAVVFSIFDGITPSNEGRGYIVRKIIRKSLLHLRSLGIEKPFLNRLVGELAQIMQKPYPDLKDRQEDIAQVILNEETNFINTLKLSGSLVDAEIDKLKEALGNEPVSQGFTCAGEPTSRLLGIAAFRLYDTNGIPLEITRGELEKRHIKAGNGFEAAFLEELEKQKNLSKSFSKMKGDVFDAKGLGLELAATKFIGYKKTSSEATILVILKNGKELKEAGAGEDVEVILDQTPFYAESGGQVGDTGELVNGKNVFEVSNTQKADNVFLHKGSVSSGSFKKGDRLNAQINTERRLNIARNHTATHILQAALRQVLGNHVQQQGSMVAEEKFRFDFTHFKGLSREEIARVEEVANGYLASRQAVECKEMAFKDAKRSGALAFFEEKYGENVRVVDIAGISKELCGGTHLENIAEIGLIKITGESSVASGIRRIEGVTAGFAKEFLHQEELRSAEETKKMNKVKELKEQEKKRSIEVGARLRGLAPSLMGKVETLNGANMVIAFEPDLDMRDLRSLADKIKEGLENGMVALGSRDSSQEKASLVIAVTGNLLTRGLDAGAVIRQVAPVIGGSGGGRKDFAQAGGSKPENFRLAFEEIRAIIKDLPIEGR